MSIYVRDYVDSYFDANQDWIEDEMLERGREMRADGVVVVLVSDLIDSYGGAQAVEDIKYDIMNDLEWEIGGLVADRLDEIAEKVMRFVHDNPESEED